MRFEQETHAYKPRTQNTNMDFKYTREGIRTGLDIDKANFWLAQAIKDEAEAAADYRATLRMLTKLRIFGRDKVMDTFRDIAREENAHLGEFVATLVYINEANGNTDVINGIKEVCERIPKKERTHVLAKMCEAVEV